MGDVGLRVRHDIELCIRVIIVHGKLPPAKKNKPARVVTMYDARRLFSFRQGR